MFDWADGAREKGYLSSESHEKRVPGHGWRDRNERGK